MTQSAVPQNTLRGILQQRGRPLVLGCQFETVKEMVCDIAGKLAVGILTQDTIEKSRCYSWLSRSPWQEYGYRCYAITQVNKIGKAALPRFDVICIDNCATFSREWLPKICANIMRSENVSILIHGNQKQLKALCADGVPLVTNDNGWVGATLSGTRNKTLQAKKIEQFVEEIEDDEI